MPKSYIRYVCRSCGRVSAARLGRCPQCGTWDSMDEETVAPEGSAAQETLRRFGQPSQPRPLSDISGEGEERLTLPIAEFGRVLGGGIVPGSIVLVAGDPGIGKSTLMLQMAISMAGREKVLYVSGEESERQIKMRASRLMRDGGDARVQFPQNLLLVTETNLGTLLTHTEKTRPRLLIVDSIQTIVHDDVQSPAGSVTQVRECAARLRELAKTSDTAVFLIGHVTKEGAIAGPKVLEHIVDTVLYLEGDRFQTYRLLRCVKNRFGATSEVGVFEMQEGGMIEVPNPSEAFLAERLVNTPGSSIAVMMEGTRPLLLEVQGLTSPTSFGNPRRTANGVDINRLLLVTAVLTRRAAMRLGEQDIFVNVVGGLQVDEPAADLAIAASIASSLYDRPVRAEAVLIGEIGLSGELRSVGQLPARLREAVGLGFKTAIIPRQIHRSESTPAALKIIEARSLRQALDEALLEKGA